MIKTTALVIAGLALGIRLEGPRTGSLALAGDVPRVRGLSRSTRVADDRAASTGAHDGRELDVGAGYRFGGHWTAGAHLVLYGADARFTDVLRTAGYAGYAR